MMITMALECNKSCNKYLTVICVSINIAFHCWVKAPIIIILKQFSRFNTTINFTFPLLWVSVVLCPRLRVTCRCMSCDTPWQAPSCCSSPAAGQPPGCGAAGARPSTARGARTRCSRRRWSWSPQLSGPWRSSWTSLCTDHVSLLLIWNGHYVVMFNNYNYNCQ